MPINYVKFSVFGSEALGKMLLPDGLSFDETTCVIPTIIHGRSVSIKISDYEWIMVKGGGWNYGGPVLYNSPKEPELFFGLYSLFAAKREKAISDVLLKFSNDFPRVLFYKEICECELPEKYRFLKTIRFNSGNLVEPTLLYTKVKCPFRVADLIYLKDEEKIALINEFVGFWHVSFEEYINKFAEELGKNVGSLHKWGFVNDSLEYSNVTLLAETVDYELFTFPGVLHEDGSDAQVMLDERREKELLYAAEVVLQLSNLLHKKTDLFSAYRLIIDSYSKINPSFIESNSRIKKIYNKEEFIL